MCAKVISFASQKGGVGKSTLLLLTASALHRRTNKKVLVIDCDPQKSIKDIYNQELQKEEAFDVVSFNWKQPKPEVNFDKTIALAENKYDVIFLDIPGKLEGKEIYFSILVSDIVIVPIVASALDIAATVKFLQTLPKVIEMKEEQGYALEVYGVVNKKDQTIEHQRLKELSGIGGLELFYSPISNLVRYKRGISTSRDIVSPEISDEFNSYFEEFRAKCFI
jgi:chromosome partitioning protein